MSVMCSYNQFCQNDDHSRDLCLREGGPGFDPATEAWMKAGKDTKHLAAVDSAHAEDAERALTKKMKKAADDFSPAEEAWMALGKNKEYKQVLEEDPQAAQAFAQEHIDTFAEKPELKMVGRVSAADEPTVKQVGKMSAAGREKNLAKLAAQLDVTQPMQGKQMAENKTFMSRDQMRDVSADASAHTGTELPKRSGEKRVPFKTREEMAAINKAASDITGEEAKPGFVDTSRVPLITELGGAPVKDAQTEEYEELSEDDLEIIEEEPIMELAPEDFELIEDEPAAQVIQSPSAEKSVPTISIKTEQPPKGELSVEEIMKKPFGQWTDAELLAVTRAPKERAGAKKTATEQPVVPMPKPEVTLVDSTQFVKPPFKSRAEQRVIGKEVSHILSGEEADATERNIRSVDVSDVLSDVQQELMADEEYTQDAKKVEAYKAAHPEQVKQAAQEYAKLSEAKQKAAAEERAREERGFIAGRQFTQGQEVIYTDKEGKNKLVMTVDLPAGLKKGSLALRGKKTNRRGKEQPLYFAVDTQAVIDRVDDQLTEKKLADIAKKTRKDKRGNWWGRFFGGR